MKKILSLLMVLFVSVGMFAETTVFYESFNSNDKTGGNDGIWANISSGGTITADNNGWSFIQGNAANQCVRFGSSKNKGSAETPSITVENGVVYKLTFNAGAWNGTSEQTTLVMSGTNATLYQDEDCSTPVTSVTMTKGAWTSYELYVRATGTYTSINIKWEGKNASNSRFFLDEVKLETNGGVQQSIAQPVISGLTEFPNTTEVTITCATEEATIYYTIDGTDPDNTSIEYTEPFELDHSATIKAIAYDGTNYSSIASKDFTQLSHYQTIAEITALTDGSKFVYDGNAVCLAQSVEKKRLYVQDATDGILIYGDTGSQTYNTADVIPSGWYGIKTTYNGTIEVTNVSNLQPSTEINNFEPIEIHLNDMENAPYNRFVKLKNAILSYNSKALQNFTATVAGEGSILCYMGQLPDYYTANNFEMPEDLSKTYDVVGILISFGTKDAQDEIIPLGLMQGDNVVTSNIEIANSNIKKNTYYNMQGIESTKPFDGLNIVVTEFDNGTKKINKRIYKF